MMKFPIYGKVKNVPNHRPVNIADIAIENCIVYSFKMLIVDLPVKTHDLPVPYVSLPEATKNWMGF